MDFNNSICQTFFGRTFCGDWKLLFLYPFTPLFAYLGASKASSEFLDAFYPAEKGKTDWEILEI